MIELKKCPFCGAVAAIMERSEQDGNLSIDSVEVVCLRCRARTAAFCTTGMMKVGSYSDAEKMAAEAWNRRTEE